MQLQLPEASADALAASRALRERIIQDIHDKGGWIGFDRYMELALYAPGLGYYSGGSAKLGKDGDFTTAPEMTPLFGRTLARLIAGLFEQTGPDILEFGAGSGKLARDILGELQALGRPAASYRIVELSGELRQRQQQSLGEFAQVQWLDRMPEHFSGVVVANEVLDAIPVRLLCKQDGHWLERGVMEEDGELRYADRPLSAPDQAALLAQIPDAEQLPDGYVSEVHPLARAWAASVATMLKQGAAIFIDYGFPAREYYLGQRSAGTLMCHYRHHSHDDPFYLPGLQDITAHVDFTDVARAGLDAGAELLLYTSQAQFLLAAGLPQLLTAISPDEQLRYLAMANAVQKLTSPAEMGELFKVLVLGRGVDLPPELLRADRSQRL